MHGHTDAHMVQIIILMAGDNIYPFYFVSLFLYGVKITGSYSIMMLFNRVNCTFYFP